MHAALADAQPTFFVDGRSVEIVPPVAWPADALRFGHGEAAHVGHAHVPLRIDPGSATILRGRAATRDSWAFDGMSLGLDDPKELGVGQRAGVAYVGDRASLLVVSYESAGKKAAAVLYPIRAEGPVVDEPVSVPTQLDLPQNPRACALADRASTSRVVEPFLPGTRHPVLVTDPIEPMRVLLTGDAVLHGSPQSPCVAAYDAEFVSSEASAASLRGERAIVSFGPSEHSFLFRMEDDARRQEPTLRYRTMSCRPDPTAEAPVEVFRQLGTLVDPG
jgi:hypothetical protein